MGLQAAAGQRARSDARVLQYQGRTSIPGAGAVTAMMQAATLDGAAAGAAQSALSLDQFKAALWPNDTVRVHAVLEGAAVTGLRERLEQADVDGWDCVWRGALSPAQAVAAPYVATLRRVSGFTDWLLTQATAAHPAWGLVTVGGRGLQAVREHARRLADAQGPQGTLPRLRWHDAGLWQALAATADASQLDTLFGELGGVVLPAAPGLWEWHTLALGQLQRRALQVMAGA